MKCENSASNKNRGKIISLFLFFLTSHKRKYKVNTKKPKHTLNEKS